MYFINRCNVYLYTHNKP